MAVTTRAIVTDTPATTTSPRAEPDSTILETTAAITAALGTSPAVRSDFRPRAEKAQRTINLQVTNMTMTGTWQVSTLRCQPLVAGATTRPTTLRRRLLDPKWARSTSSAPERGFRRPTNMIEAIMHTNWTRRRPTRYWSTAHLMVTFMDLAHLKEFH